jgi:ATP-dependent RNA helicase DeaD
MQTINHFQDIQLSPWLMQSLNKLGFNTPTPIQAQTIPLALQKKDILGSAQTGTGKTLAFTLPLLHHISNNPMDMGLIIAPTRELAQQIVATVNQLLVNNRTINTALLIGGEPYNKQLFQLRKQAHIVVGTPGRIIDHLQQRNFLPNRIHYLVLDETDRMFDMGFSIQLEQIIRQLPSDRQTLMFSATFPPKVEKLAAQYLRQPERIFINQSHNVTVQVANNLVQETIMLKEVDKYDTLLEELKKREGTILVFVKTKINAEKLAIRLRQADFNTCAIHGDLRQNKRDKVMAAFRRGQHKIMVATDIAARGLDVPHVLHVINYDIPHAPEDYVHRTGRTARAGSKGFAISFISEKDTRPWHAIQELLHPTTDRPGIRKYGPAKPWQKRDTQGSRQQPSIRKYRSSNPANFRRFKQP